MTGVNPPDGYAQHADFVAGRGTPVHWHELPDLAMKPSLLVSVGHDI